MHWHWYIRVMIDTWHLIIYMIWHILYCVLSTLLFIYFMHVTYYPVYFYSSTVVICIHCFCTAPSLFILHTHWVAFWRPYICTSRLDVLFYCSGIWWDHICCEELEFSSINSGILTFFYYVISLIFDIFDSFLILFLLFIRYHCVRNLYVILQ